MDGRSHYALDRSLARLPASIWAVLPNVPMGHWEWRFPCMMEKGEVTSCANVDSGSPSCLMDYTCSPEIMQSFDHDTTDYASSQGEDERLNTTAAGTILIPDLASRARQFLDISSKRPEPMADIYIDPSTSPECISSSNLSWPGSHMDPSISTSVGTSSSSIPSPDIGSLLLGMPPPGIDSSSSSMPSLSTSSYAEDGVDQSRVAATQPSSVGQSPQVQRDYLYSPSPVRSQPAIISAKDYQDQILQEDRRNGWSYKKIRAVRNFGVTESTLRGRYRNLIKSSHERPRQPTWTEKDAQLLMIAVPRFTPTTGSRRVSWKAMAEFIQTHGDSPYTLAYATCKKKWIKLLTPANGSTGPTHQTCRRKSRGKLWKKEKR
ncbi:hypothetical protein E4U13_005464 [Claviceps humidiphila]|uniref:Myb-like domain-containing protein n=1 Tax=Claviceps humidiphila TaxID=1294629 RepID=A0A9P7PXC0_9HYPO|nr:hypothetical protein E4U13_005464 [Claviceps humidiphila]